MSTVPLLAFHFLRTLLALASIVLRQKYVKCCFKIQIFITNVIIGLTLFIESSVETV